MPLIHAKRKLVRLTPSLNVFAGSNGGKLVALNQEQLVIDWSNQFIFDQGTLTIVLPNDRSIEVSATFDGRAAFPDNDASKKALLDLLHQVRKEQHIHICATEAVEASETMAQSSHGFAALELPHVALPEMAWHDIDPSREFMGHSFSAPLLITGMTGGVEKAAMINERLAFAATKFNIPMGVGSQRLALENPQHVGIFQLKHKFPNLFLIANVGIAQILNSDSLKICEAAVTMIDANALAIHVNILQELVQVEGDRNFRGAIERIGHIAQNIGVPVLIKEVGAGLDPKTILALYNVGVRYFDVGGRGGTSWAYIEGRRSADPSIQRLGQTFRDWGIPTAVALKQANELKLTAAQWVATGGIRDGVTALKAIYAGASMAGIGLPLFRAALEDELGPSRELEQIVLELKIAMMCGGMSRLAF